LHVTVEMLDDAYSDTSHSSEVTFGVLGPLLVTRGGAPVYLATAYKPRLVLAALLAAEEVASVDWLTEVVWGDRPPASARRNIQQYVHRLRCALGPELLAGRRGGYALVSRTIDSTRFRELAADGQAALEAGEFEPAAERLRAALDLWRGPAFAEFHDSEPIAERARPLEQLRLDTVLLWSTAALAMGRNIDVALELADVLKTHPYREDVAGQCMHALCRAGRRADALELYRNTHALFRDELGIEPGPELQRLHQSILRGDVTAAGQLTALGTTGAPVPRELPRPAAGFTGRDDAIRKLDGLLRDDPGETGRLTAIAAVVGAAGIGKTALAVHWAHRVADRFPDGQLYVDLGGHAPGLPVRSIDALARMLRALGVRPERIPVDVAEAAAMYRSSCAGRRLLVVLDNAASADQVRPLIPGSRSCLVLVTSRERLSGLTTHEGVLRLTLDVLTAAEANHLLSRTLGAERVLAEPDASRKLAELCSHLPLALRIVSANLVDRPDRRIADSVATLRADPIAALDVGEDGDRHAVRYAFDLSYRRLPMSARRLFRRLGLVACHDFTDAMAAALAGTTVAEAHRELDRLAAKHLVEQRRCGRYGVHDLIRHYADNLAHAEDTPVERFSAVTRLCAYYLEATTGAANLLDPVVVLFNAHLATKPPPGVADHSSALLWLDAERHNLVDVIRHAARHGPAEIAWQLAEALRGYFALRRHMVDWLTAARAGLAAARTHGDDEVQTVALHGLAHVYWCLGNPTRAMTYLNRAIALAPSEHAMLHATLVGCRGILLANLGRLDEALLSFAAASALFERAGFRRGLVAPALNTAQTHLLRGGLREARDAALGALSLSRQVDARKKEAAILCTLGDCYRQLGEFEEATACLTEALDRNRELANQEGEADALRLLALIEASTGQVGAAGRHADESLELARAADSRLMEACATHALAVVCQARKEFDRALDLHQRALSMVDEAHHAYERAQSMLGLATTNHQVGRFDIAIQHAAQALELAGRAGLRVLEGQALTALAAAHLAIGDRHQATALARRALDSHRRTWHRPGEASAHLALGGAVRAAGDLAPAADHNRRARALYAEMKIPVPIG
jgi:DNA-binding SARP family transcriptional activator